MINDQLIIIAIIVNKMIMMVNLVTFTESTNNWKELKDYFYFSQLKF